MGESSPHRGLQQQISRLKSIKRKGGGKKKLEPAKENASYYDEYFDKIMHAATKKKAQQAEIIKVDIAEQKRRLSGDEKAE